MSDDSTTESETPDEPRRTEDTMTETTGDHETENRDGRDLRRTLDYALLAGLSLLALIATLQLYFNVSSAIDQWITYEYRSLFQAAFNLTVLLLVSAGMVWQVRRMRE